MHELSIARGIADIVCGLVEPRDRKRIRSINVDVGAMSGVVPDSLSFCFEAVALETDLPPKSLAIRRIPFRCYCRTCRREFEGDHGIVLCTGCGGGETEIRTGRELRVVTIDLDDVPSETS